MVYLSEASNQIFCEFHANVADHPTKPLSFENELLVSKAALYSVEKLLVIVQEQLCFIKSENTEKDMALFELSEDELDSNFDELKLILK